MRHSGNNPLPLGNPLANALVVVVGVVLIAASFVLGVIAFLALGSIFLALAAIVAIRVWWFRWRMRRARPPREVDGSRDGIIEGEYHVISVRQRKTGRDRSGAGRE